MMRAEDLVNSEEEYTNTPYLSQNMSENTIVDANKQINGNGKVVICDSHGSISVKGRRKRMEDALTVNLGFLMWESKKYDYFGVYDGHGGSQVAQACSDHLHKLVIKEVEKQARVMIDWEKVMVTSFLRMDEQVIAERIDGSIGSTAIAAVVGEEVMVVANCGDCRGVLSRSSNVVPLSSDHKPDRSDELKRIEVSGGVVVNWNGKRVQGVLATSRSIGDEHLKPYVIAEAEVTVKTRSDLDEFIILASDGLWDVISNEEACKFVRFCLKRQSQEESVKKSSVISDDENETKSRAAVAARNLKRIAMKRGSQDNISIIVIDLKKHPKNSA
ncbi:Protein-serine/threonine phosphatase [Heracleum sosnowskyi]|uniref:protein-serine/threonine phosphatase n=1 Tax=Heracleum sosnowskyi TaxID=360622 RepID=A0AAD8J0F9_9APIA|nr:Protein-serine/threonine phosphatase [Heracleum sosnowskyi]